MKRLLIIVILLVLSPVSWGHDPGVATEGGTWGSFYFQLDDNERFYTPLNTRLAIHWLDSVVIDTCEYWYSHLSGTGGIVCDTIGWTMTVCSLSVIGEEE